jgi:hypothetical protein
MNGEEAKTLPTGSENRDIIGGYFCYTRLRRGWLMVRKMTAADESVIF